MRKCILFLMLISFLVVPVSALELEAPEVPESGEIYMPEETDSFGDGLWYIIKQALASLQPSIAEALGVCACVIAAVLLLSVVNNFAGNTKHVVELAGTVAIGIILVKPANSLLHLGISTIDSLAAYSKLFLPVMTTAVAAQGGITTSAALYTGTSIFCTVLTVLISNVIVPMIYVQMAISIADHALENELLSNLQKFLKWLISWSLKTVLYVFTGYISITGVISGSADATAIKATKIALSGVVPVVGSIIADTSETLLVSAGTIKNTAGIYGLLAILSVCIGPFFQTGIHYLLLKTTSALCEMLGTKRPAKLVKDFSGIMGLLLAMTGTVCLLLLISTVCFMKGVPY